MKITQGKIDLLLITLMGLGILINAVFFLFVREKTILGWLEINLCVVAEAIAIIGLIRKNKVISSIAVPMLMSFAIGGIILFNWTDFAMIKAQIDHILMIVVAIYIMKKNLPDSELEEKIRSKEYRKIAIGILIGIIATALIGGSIGKKPYPPKTFNKKDLQKIKEIMDKEKLPPLIPDNLNFNQF